MGTGGLRSQRWRVRLQSATTGPSGPSNRFVRYRQRTTIELAKTFTPVAGYLSAATTASKNGTTGNVPLPAGSVCAPQTTMTTFSLRLR